MKKAFFLLSLAYLLSACNKLNTDTFFVFLHQIPDRPVISDDSVKSLQQGHIQNINRLYAEGKLAAAGPFEGGGGLFFLKARNIEEAKSYLNSDPAVRAKKFNIEIHPFIFETGSLCRLDSSYSMATYHFIQFTSSKNEVLPDKERETYFAGIKLLEAKVIMEGFFSDNNTHLLLIDTTGTEFFNEKLNALAVSFTSFYKMERKRLWIAKGTFCEEKAKTLEK